MDSIRRLCDQAIEHGWSVEVLACEVKLALDEADNAPSTNKVNTTTHIVVNHMRAVTDRRFDLNSPQTRRRVRGLMKSGASTDMMKAVIDAKWAQWGSDPEFRKRVCPSTIFRPMNFWKYHEEDVVAADSAESRESLLFGRKVREADQ